MCFLGRRKVKKNIPHESNKEHRKMFFTEPCGISKEFSLKRGYRYMRAGKQISRILKILVL